MKGSGGEASRARLHAKYNLAIPTPPLVETQLPRCRALRAGFYTATETVAPPGHRAY